MEQVNKANAIFDLAKLDWMNGQYLRLPLEEIALRCKQLFLEKGLISATKKYHLSIAVAGERTLCLMKL